MWSLLWFRGPVDTHTTISNPSAAPRIQQRGRKGTAAALPWATLRRRLRAPGRGSTSLVFGDRRSPSRVAPPRCTPSWRSSSRRRCARFLSAGENQPFRISRTQKRVEGTFPNATTHRSSRDRRRTGPPRRRAESGRGRWRSRTQSSWSASRFHPQPLERKTPETSKGGQVKKIREIALTKKKWAQN